MSSSATLQNQLRRLISSPAINQNAISGFQAAANPTTQGVDITFTLTDDTGVSGILLYRNNVLDPATATAIQAWFPAESDFSYSDTAIALQQQASAFYWLQLLPQGTSGSPVTVGPQNILLDPQLGAPLPSVSISASHSAASNGVLTVTVNVQGSAATQKIYVSGYKGNAAFVAVAQSASSPIQFALQATGETITLEAIGVSAGGTEAATGPTTSLTLDGALTVPAQPQGIVIDQIATGNQITFPASKDSVTSYRIYRSDRGDGFGAAALLATVMSTAGTVEYLDTTGLGGDYEYYVIATNAAGDSLPSNSANPPVLYSSSSIPANVPANTTNTATVDSIDAGTSATVRIYGPGGVGSGYDRVTGYATNVARASGTVAGLLYKTLYAVLWTGSAYIADSSYPATLPDGYEFVGSLMTCGAAVDIGGGATVTLVIDTNGHIIQANPGALGADFTAASVNVSGGGGGSGAVIQANVDLTTGTIPSYTVIDGGDLYTSTPAGAVVGAAYPGTVGGGGSSGSSAGSRNAAQLP